MRQTLKKHRLYAVLLAAAMIFTLLPIKALAAPAIGTASGTVGNSTIQVNLAAESGEFSPNEAAVENHGYWTLVATSGAQEIASVEKIDAKSVTIMLTTPITAGNTFTLNATEEVFASGTQSFATPLAVTISGTNVCAIGGSQYPTLNAAIVAAPAGTSTTITLLQDITQTGGISVTGKSIVFALGNFDLTVNTTEDKALEATDGSVSYTGAGSFAVTGDGGYAVKVYSQNAPASATVTSATATADEGFGVHAYGENASVTVNGPVSATHPNRGYGVYAEDGGSVTVNGNVSAARYGVTARSGSAVTVNGNVSTTGANCYAVSADGAGSTVRVTGNVTASGEDCVGVSANNGAEITIDGVLSSTRTYIVLENEIALEADENDEATTKMGYRTYSNMRSQEVVTSVWVAGGEAAEPAVVTSAATGVTASGAQLSGSVTYSGEGPITQRGFVYATHTGPTTGYDTKIQAGSGTGSFQAPVTGLSTNTVYYVRAYAIYSGEVVYYGNEISFTTSAAGFPQTPGNRSKGLPTVVTEGITGVTVSGGTFLGRVVSSGGAVVTGRGFVLGTEPAPFIGKADAAKIPSGSGIGSFSADAGSLLPDTTYYVRAYATNSQGTAYGETLRFATGYIGDAQHAIPKTGDNSAPWAGWLMLGASALTLLGLAVLGKRKAR